MKTYKLALHGQGTIRIYAPNRAEAIARFREQYPNMLIKSPHVREVKTLVKPSPPSESPGCTCSNDTDPFETMRNSCKIAHRTP